MQRITENLGERGTPFLLDAGLLLRTEPMCIANQDQKLVAQNALVPVAKRGFPSSPELSVTLVITNSGNCGNSEQKMALPPY